MCLNNCQRCKECDALSETECCKVCCNLCFDQSVAEQKTDSLDQDIASLMLGATGLSGQGLADVISQIDKANAQKKQITIRDNLFFPPEFE